ncbi:MAG: cyclic nucleotide-binding domain-containing protein [Thermodesulfobacteriota bacterium]
MTLQCEFLKKISLFQDLEEHEIQQVLDRTTPRNFLAGAVILREGERGDSLFVMCQGEVEITKALTLVLDEDTPKEKVMIRLRALDGVCFGEMALLENEARSATVTALSDCSLLELNRQEFLTLVRDNPEMGLKLVLNLAQLLSRHLRKSNQDVIKLTTALAIALEGKS